MIDHFDLFGLKQAWNAGRTCRPSSDFRVVLLYRLVRHPIMLGFLVMFWAVPRMTLDHLVLSLGLTAYILVALHFEERDLVEEHGEAYRRYRREVSALIPLPRAAEEEPVAPARR
jgi:protein-S-isoprenylcysteine O-methyltransferase Ste14